MNVLFIYRGYGPDLANAVIDHQRQSLKNTGIQISTVIIESGKISGYVRAFFKIRDHLSHNACDLIHAHYAWSALLARMASRKPIVCSLMGSDLLQCGKLVQFAIRLFYRFLWKETIVKSQEMKRILPRAILIPNGINLNLFTPLHRATAFLITGFDPSEKNILFVAKNPNSKVKNLSLAVEAIRMLQDPKAKLKIISEIEADKMPWFYNAADLLLVTSLTEGSSNVIKEALASDCPVVSTNAGDAHSLLPSIKGCHITSFDQTDIAGKIKDVLNSGQRIEGRKCVLDLNEVEIARHIIELYFKTHKRDSYE